MAGPGGGVASPPPSRAAAVRARGARGRGRSRPPSGSSAWRRSTEKEGSRSWRGGEATEEMEKEYREKSEKIQTREQQEVYRGGGESTGGEAGRERNYITILEKYLIDACLIINASVNTKACAGYWLRKSISKCFVPPLIGR